jgi:tRNA(fMet)-specific endonuclease VapC
LTRNSEVIAMLVPTQNDQLPKPNQSVLEQLEKYQDEIATATIVWHELLFSCQRLSISRKREKLEQYLYQTVAQLPILPYTQEAAEWHAAERARL